MRTNLPTKGAGGAKTVESDPVPPAQAFPVVTRQRRARLVVGRLAALVGHLQEQQIDELLDVVTVAHAVVAQDVAVAPGFLDDGCCVHFDLCIGLVIVVIHQESLAT